MRLGIIGAGNMGLPIAHNLMRAGNTMNVYARHPETVETLLGAGARLMPDAASVAAASDIVFTCLPGPAEVREIALGKRSIIAGCHDGMVYIDLSTNSPKLLREIHAIMLPMGVQVLDAPISGGTYGAATGELAVMVGGDEATLQRLLFLFRAIGDKVQYCGAVGAGMVCKLTNNLINLSIAVVLGEALTTGVKSGVDLPILFEAISNSSGNSRRMQAHMTRHLFAGDFGAGFALALATKDVRLAIEMAQDADNPLDISHAVYRKLTAAIARGWADEDCDAVIKLQEEKSGVELRAPGLTVHRT